MISQKKSTREKQAYHKKRHHSRKNSSPRGAYSKLATQKSPHFKARKSPRISPNTGFDASISTRVQWPCSLRGSLQRLTGLSPSPIRRESWESSPDSDLSTRKNV